MTMQADDSFNKTPAGAASPSFGQFQSDTLTNPMARSHHSTKICTNCQTMITPLWRRDPEGQLLCNACGLYLKTNHVVRPLHLKRDVVKRRNRSPGRGRIPQSQKQSLSADSDVCTKSITHPLDEQELDPEGKNPGEQTQQPMLWDREINWSPLFRFDGDSGPYGFGLIRWPE